MLKLQTLFETRFLVEPGKQQRSGNARLQSNEYLSDFESEWRDLEFRHLRHFPAVRKGRFRMRRPFLPDIH